MDNASLSEEEALRQELDKHIDYLNDYFNGDMDTYDKDTLIAMICAHKGNFDPPEGYELESAVLRICDKLDKYHQAQAKAEKGDEKEDEGDEVYTTESIVKNVGDSVVEITTESVQTDSFFGEYVAQGAGSGIIITEDGYVATNDHVIDGAKEVSVRLRNGETYEAKLLGTDSRTDVAALSITEEN